MKKNIIVIIMLAFITSTCLILLNEPLKHTINNTINKSIENKEKLGITNRLSGHCNLSINDYNNGEKRFNEVSSRLTPLLKEYCESKDLTFGNPVFLRTFKQEKQLELWLYSDKSKNYQLLFCWHISALSGKLGPKLKEGDGQSPEGFYSVPKGMLHPSSRFHLAFNVGFPNQYDKAHQRTGSFIMVHGNKVSVGCLAMTDPLIEEIYTLCHAALHSGKQSRFDIHMFPFRLTEENLKNYKENPNYAFWKNLKSGYDYFEKNKKTPEVSVKNKLYSFQ